MICLTVSLYAMARELGAEGALEEFRKQLANPLDPNALPCVRAIARLRGVDKLALNIDVGGSATPKMRSRAAHAAFSTGADCWMSIDDDVEATFETLKALHEAVAGNDYRVVIAPCWLRGTVADSEGKAEVHSVNVAFEADAEQHARVLPSGAKCWPATAGGFGLVAMSRATLEHAIVTNTHLTYRDDDGQQRVGLFHEDLSDGRWWGEDLSFFRHLPPDISVEMLVTGHTAHANMVLDLSTVAEQTRMRLDGFRVVVEGILEDAPVTSPVSSSEQAPPPAG